MTMKATAFGRPYWEDPWDNSAIACKLETDDLQWGDLSLKCLAQANRVIQSLGVFCIRTRQQWW